MALDRPYGRYLTDSDALLWNVEKDPLLRSTITVIAVLDGPPDWPRLRARLERATHLMPRLRQRVVVPPLRVGPPRWLVDRTFDLDYHVRHVAAPPPADWRTVLDLAQPLAMAAFDRARPLWEMTLIEGLADGRAVLLAKVHHAMVDGVGGIEIVGDLLLDLERHPDPDPLRAPVPDPPPPDELGALAIAAGAAVEQGRQVLDGVGRGLRRLVGEAAVAVAAPGVAAEEGLRTARSVGRMVAPVTEPLSPVMRDRSLAWWFDTLDVALAPMLDAAHAAGGTLNDAFVTALTGGLRRYHELHGVSVPELRMTMPINLRRPGDAPGGNRFVPARFGVPLEPADPMARLQEVRRRTHAWRHEPGLALTDGLAAVLNRLPTSATTALFGGMLKGVDFVATNVPGAPVPVFLAGAQVERFYALAPPSGSAVNFALVSHGGTCCLGANVDLAAVPDPEALARCVAEGFDEVLSLVPAHDRGVA